MHLIGESSFELHMQKDFICKASENPKCTEDFRFAPKWPSGAPKCTKTLLYQKIRYNSEKSTCFGRCFFILMTVRGRKTLALPGKLCYDTGR